MEEYLGGGPLGPLKARQVKNGVRAGVAEMVKVGGDVMRSKCEGWNMPTPCKHLSWREEGPDCASLPSHPWCEKFDMSISDAANKRHNGPCVGRAHYEVKQ